MAASAVITRPWLKGMFADSGAVVIFETEINLKSFSSRVGLLRLHMKYSLNWAEKKKILRPSTEMLFMLQKVILFSLYAAGIMNIITERLWIP